MSAASLTFSRFGGAKGIEPEGQITISDMVKLIRSDTLRAQIESIRAAKATGDDDVAARLKQGLPAVTISGLFGERKTGGLQAHSGLMVLDFDDVGPEKLAALMPQLVGDPHVQAAFISPSGAGLKVVVRIPADPAKHRAAFEAATAYFKQAHGVDADQSGKDVSRLCFLSHDPDAYLRDSDAVEFVPVAEAPKPPRTVALTPPSLPEIRSALDALDPDIDYGQWIRIGMSIHAALPGQEGLQMWDEWSSRAAKYQAGDCSSRWSGFRSGEITIASLFGLARDAGWRRTLMMGPPAVPTHGIPSPAGLAATEIPVVILPSGGSTITVCAEVLGQQLGVQQLVFNRGGTLARVSRSEDGTPRLETVIPATLASTFEKVALLARIGKDGPEPAICTEQTARLISNSDAFREALPRITVISPCSVLVERDGHLIEVNGHDPESGIYAGGMPAKPMEMDEARRLLAGVIEGFRFATPGDRARGLASLITPALTFGGLLGGRPPIDLGEANDSQTGKGYRNKLVAAIYGQSVRTVTQKSGGVGSLEESFNSALIGGANFIALDNIRGRLDSPAIESFLTEDHYSARIPYRESVDIDPRRVMVMFTSNKADVTQDLANRSSCVRILKHADGHVFQAYPEGDILDHVRANQPRFLGAVFAIVRAWHGAGKPRSQETRHDFRRWAQVMDWIVQNLLGAVPLMEGHRETQQRMTNPALSWLRIVAQAVIRARKDAQWLKSNAIINVLEDTVIEIPGIKGDVDLTDPQAQKAVLLAVGRQLGRCFNAGDIVQIDNLTIERRQEYDAQYSKATREYLFTTNHLAGTEPAGTSSRAADPVQPVREQTPAEQMAAIHKFLDRTRAASNQPVGVN